MVFRLNDKVTFTHTALIMCSLHKAHETNT